RAAALVVATRRAHDVRVALRLRLRHRARLAARRLRRLAAPPRRRRRARELTMRVLQCIDTLGGGGAERQLTYLAGGLVRLGHEVDVVCHVDGPWAQPLREAGATLHRLGWLDAWRLVPAIAE